MNNDCLIKVNVSYMLCIVVLLAQNCQFQQCLSGWVVGHTSLKNELLNVTILMMHPWFIHGYHSDNN